MTKIKDNPPSPEDVAERQRLTNEKEAAWLAYGDAVNRRATLKIRRSLYAQARRTSDALQVHQEKVNVL